jgi:hypothetical protein
MATHRQNTCMYGLCLHKRIAEPGKRTGIVSGMPASRETGREEEETISAPAAPAEVNLWTTNSSTKSPVRWNASARCEVLCCLRTHASDGNRSYTAT